MGAHIKEVKFKEAVRLRNLHALFNKRRFGPQGTISYGEVTRKYMEKTSGR